MPKKYLKSHEKAQVILDFLKDNPRSRASLISRCTGLGLSTVYKTIDELGDALTKKRVRVSMHHRADVFSINHDDSQKVIIKKVGKCAVKRDYLTEAMYGVRR